MTTITDSPASLADTLVFAAVPDHVLAQFRGSRLDDAGRTPRAVVETEGGSPLRCCLRRSVVGDELLLASYAPMRHGPRDERFTPGGYDEVGPIFVHAQDCGGYRAESEYPPEFGTTPQVFRTYGWTGAVTGGRVVEPDEDHAAAAAELLADPAVAFVHTHNVVYGCFMIEIRRNSSRL